jgi:hypothetical protein
VLLVRGYSDKSSCVIKNRTYIAGVQLYLLAKEHYNREMSICQKNRCKVGCDILFEIMNKAKKNEKGEKILDFLLESGLDCQW